MLTYVFFSEFDIMIYNTLRAYLTAHFLIVDFGTSVSLLSRNGKSL